MIGVTGTVLLIAAAVVVALRERQPALPMPDVPVAASPAEVRVRAVERRVETLKQGEVVAASGVIAIVCGRDKTTAGRYEVRNDALRSIARRRDLPKGDVEALLAYLRSVDDAMRVERVAALKNDVMNLLRNQEPPVEGLAETLIAMIEGRHVAGFGRTGRAGVPPPAAVADGTPSLPGNTIHPPVVIDYCIQHLGAMVNELDDAKRSRVREVFVRAAREKTKPYAGTALYSLAEDKRATAAQEGELKRLTLALCKPGVNNVSPFIWESDDESEADRGVQHKEVRHLAALVRRSWKLHLLGRLWIWSIFPPPSKPRLWYNIP